GSRGQGCPRSGWFTSARAAIALVRASSPGKNEKHTMNHRPSSFRARALRWPLALYCAVCALAMMVIGGADFTRLYVPSPYHRLQADALLQGQLHLADSIYQVGHDLAWHDGQVNQIWGLGVGLWLLPFEGLWRLLGQKWFPDRIALGIAFALLTWYAGTAAWRLAQRTKSPATGIAVVWFVTLCPALWTLNQGGRLIYEETSWYACVVSLGLLVRVACFGEHKDFFICAGLAGLSALVRPTHGIYGLLAISVCTALALARGWHWRALLAGNAVFVVGVGMLAFTNWSRFGSPTEFGHRLTVTPGIIVFMTRIDNPMKEASFSQAARELCGWLFLTRNVQAREPDAEAVPGQARFERWRDAYMTTFSPAWALMIIAALVGAAHWLRCESRAGLNPQRLFCRPGRALALSLLVWGSGSVLALAWFYLRFPNMSSRYLLDFAPGFTGLALFVWLPSVRKGGWLALLVLAGWLGGEILTSQVRPAPAALLTRDRLRAELPKSDGRPLADFGGAYSVTNSPEATRISYNGYGWVSGSGLAGNIVILALDQPEFIELVVEARETDAAHGVVRQDQYRAMIDAVVLPLQEVREVAKGVRAVRFQVPEKIRRRRANELLFLCFSEGFDAEDRESQRLLHSVRWR
ncbi:MAG TPA: hypothetical protein VFZ59_09040, partial [Verrucomicrobiae bacterium]|nr:hypothetical protein [Verrucomicrobiae bacterium]